MRRGVLPALVTAIAAVGCSGDSEAPVPVEPTITTVDGVRIVENHAPLWGDGEGWRISDEPILTLGVDAGEPQEMLTNPSAVRLGDGRIVVTEWSSSELRYYDASGGHLLTRGGKGEGPGQFRSIRAPVATPRDGVLVYDNGLRRHAEYSPSGEFVDHLRLEEHGVAAFQRAQVIGVFEDGSLIAEARPTRESDYWFEAFDGEIGRRSVGLFHYDATGTAPRFLTDVVRYEATMQLGQHVAFAARGQIAPHAMGFCHSDGRSFRIECFSRDGDLELMVLWQGDVAAVTSPDVDGHITKSMENLGDNPNAELWIRQTAWATNVPVLHDLLVDATGNIWAERHIGLLHTAPLSTTGMDGFKPDGSSWEVFDSEGIWLGRVDLIPGRVPQQIGDDWILTAGEDDAGVAHVWLYELSKQ